MSEAILYPGRDLLEVTPGDQPICFENSKRLGEHFLGDPRNATHQITVAPGAVT